ncbi:PrgU family protein (plasmid) [Enterococcus faecalis]
MNIIKNGKSFGIRSISRKSIYVKPNLDRINVPVFLSTHPLIEEYLKRSSAKR